MTTPARRDASPLIVGRRGRGALVPRLAPLPGPSPPPPLPPLPSLQKCRRLARDETLLVGGNNPDRDGRSIGTNQTRACLVPLRIE